jgi:hypothetical protein
MTNEDAYVSRFGGKLLLGIFALTSAGSFMSAADAQERMKAAEIRNLIVGKEVTWLGGGQSLYAKGGYYRWLGRGRTSEGTYTIGDGVICYKFNNGRLRCDAWYRNGTQVCLEPMHSKESRNPMSGRGCSSSIR